MHYDARGPITKLRPATYRLEHIDFDVDTDSFVGTQYNDDTSHFTIEAGGIYFFGHIQLDRRGKGQYRTTLIMDKDLAQDACAANPDIFERFPVINIHNGDKFRLNCMSDEP